MSQQLQPTDTEIALANGSVQGKPRAWLRIEAVAVLSIAVGAYAVESRSWLLFIALFLLPDISFLAYLGGPRIGAAFYNSLHSYVFPIALVSAHYVGGPTLSIPLIWIAHIAFDRVLGYGLKYDAGFVFTHLGRLGKTI
jgi:Domain of unknown function (DUF4260)